MTKRSEPPIGDPTPMNAHPDDPAHDDDPFDAAARPAPGGPYFGRLLVVLFAAVVFCGLITWFLSSTVAP